MGKDRLAAFSDGVIAIIITIMVLELMFVPFGAWAISYHPATDLNPLAPLSTSGLEVGHGRVNQLPARVVPT